MGPAFKSLQVGGCLVRAHKQQPCRKEVSLPFRCRLVPGLYSVTSPVGPARQILSQVPGPAMHSRSGGHEPGHRYMEPTATAMDTMLPAETSDQEEDDEPQPLLPPPRRPAGYNAVGFDYGQTAPAAASAADLPAQAAAPAPAAQAQPQQQPSGEQGADKPFVPTFLVPHHLRDHLPSLERMHKVRGTAADKVHQVNGCLSSHHQGHSGLRHVVRQSGLSPLQLFQLGLGACASSWPQGAAQGVVHH